MAAEQTAVAAVTALKYRNRCAFIVIFNPPLDAFYMQAAQKYIFKSGAFSSMKREYVVAYEVCSSMKHITLQAALIFNLITSGIVIVIFHKH